MDDMSDNLASEYEALLQFLYIAPVGLVQTNMAGEIVLINPKSAQLLMPLQKNGDLANLFDALDLVAPELRNLVTSFAGTSGLICDNVHCQVSHGVSDKAGTKILAITLIKLDKSRLMAVISDVTQSVKREQQLKQSDAWLNAVMTGSSEYAFVSLDADGLIPHWNPSIEKLLGFSATETIGHPYSLFSPPTAVSVERVSDYLREADDSGWSLHEDWCVRADGSQFWGSWMIAPIEPSAELSLTGGNDARAGGGDDHLARRVYALVIRDVSEKRSATEEMLRASFNDHLTGIANRRYFFDAAELEIKRWHRSPRSLSLLAIDADYFKKINDTFGHPAGDLVLRHLAQMLVQAVRNIDIVARIGGEEFAILLPGTDLQLAGEVAERILQSISSQVVLIDGREIRYTVSIGVCGMDASLHNATDLLKAADEALYVAKNTGRNRVSIASAAGAIL